ncbi:MAG TPA: hypothetical protein VMR20_13380, partial [Verrucomicrobiae bacterium]|nr:hypothetical protein [Verrucomicrobiae bacterium]
RMREKRRQGGYGVAAALPASFFMATSGASRDLFFLVALGQERFLTSFEMTFIQFLAIVLCKVRR